MTVETEGFSPGTTRDFGFANRTDAPGGDAHPCSGEEGKDARSRAPLKNGRKRKDFPPFHEHFTSFQEPFGARLGSARALTYYLLRYVT
jgi:hypothetical protein